MANIIVRSGRVPRYVRTDVVNNGDVYYKVYDNLAQCWINDVSSEQWNKGTMRLELMQVYFEEEVDELPN